MALTAARIKTLTEPGRYADRDGLYLYISSARRKSFVLRITANGRRRDFGLGPCHSTTLATARQRARTIRHELSQPINDGPDTPVLTIPTFRQAADAVYVNHQHRWRTSKHAAGWAQMLERHAMPTLADMPLDQIRRSHVLATLTPIWSTHPETARKLRQRIRTIFKWAIAHEYIDLNPAGEAIDGALPPIPKIRSHFRSLPYGEVADALASIDNSMSCSAVKLCLRFVVLTATRSSEARNATWNEIDLDTAIWRIPAARMKSGIEHRIPLSRQALNVLADARKLDSDTSLIFPSNRKRNTPMSDMALTKTLRDNGLAHRATVHGFRSSFKNWTLEQTDAPWAVSETALAHTLGNATEQAYARTDLFNRRKQLMQDWADFISP